MNEFDATIDAKPALKTPAKRLALRRRDRGLAATLLTITVLFSRSLYDLAHFAWGSELYSQILLIPFVCGYFIWGQREKLVFARPGRFAPAASLFALAAFTLGAYGVRRMGGAVFSPADYLAFSTMSFVFSVAGAFAFFLQGSALRAVAFPLGFLVFMVPLPDSALHAVEVLMQYGSASVAHAMFDLAGTAVFYHDLHFQLPGINLLVAPECSGIRSTLALLATSAVTGYLFLRKPVSCAVLIAAVLPLALLRNGFRIFTLGQLCVHVSPEMIDSAIHHQGGPIFFALSLIPFFGLLAFLRQRERKVRAARALS